LEDCDGRDIIQSAFMRRKACSNLKYEKCKIITGDDNMELEPGWVRDVYIDPKYFYNVNRW